MAASCGPPQVAIADEAAARRETGEAVAALWDVLANEAHEWRPKTSEAANNSNPLQNNTT
jgi:hypothetical protein